MKLVRRIALVVSVLILVGSLTAAIALSGPQHMICPSCHDLKPIAPNVFVEPSISRSRQLRILQNLRTARQRTAKFFGELKSNPRIVVCRSARCAAVFGSKGAKGVAYGWMAVLLRPSRIFATIATHELVHIELHWRMGFSGWMRGTVPVWFDEGLATVISEDPRLTRDLDASAVADIMNVKSYLGEWSAHANRVGWRTAYGAAATRVRQLERRIGRDGLWPFVKMLIRDGNLDEMLKRAEAGQAF